MDTQETHNSALPAEVARRDPSVESLQERPFHVEAKDSASWFNSFQQIQKGELPRRGFTLGKLDLNDKVFSDIHSTAIVSGGKEDTDVHYMFNAKMGYSQEHLEKDGGYHPIKDVVKLKQLFQEQGVSVTFETNGNGQLMTLEKNGQMYSVSIGLTSAQEYPSEKRDQLNFPILFSSQSKEGADCSTALSDQVAGFSQMLETFVNAYYQVQNVSPPNEVFSLHIPDWESYIGDDSDLLDDSEISAMRHRESSFDGTRLLQEESNQQVGYLLTEAEKAERPSFEDIGGQPHAVSEAKKLVQSIRYADLYAKRGVARPRGILLDGPPGVGKTLLAKAIAREADAEFMSLSIADLSSKWYGETTQKVQKFFDTAKKLTDEGKDVIAFFDEIESVVPKREDSHEATKSMVDLFLLNMDGLRNNPKLTLLGATNNKNGIDPAMLRPGRFDKQITMELPNESGRVQILGIHLQRHQNDATEPEEIISPSIDLASIAKELGEVSGADIASIVNLSLEEKVTAEINYLEGNEGGRPWSPLTGSELLQARPKNVRSGKKVQSIGFS